MAIKVNNVTVIDDSRNATVVNASTNSLTYSGTNVLATAAEINQLDGLTDNVQSQLDGSAAVVGTLDRTFTSGETVSLTLSESVPTPIVSVIKEVPQTGVISNDWDVASDGTNYTLHDTAYDTTLSRGIIFDLSGASYTSNNVSVSSQQDDASGFFFKPDGTKLYVVGAFGDQAVYQYSLTTPWDITTLSYDNKSFSYSSEGNGVNDLFIGDSGSKMYLLGRNARFIFEYDLSTTWDISTAVYSGQSFATDNEGEDTVQGLFFKDDGTSFYMVGTETTFVYQYDLTTPWDLSTASYSGKSFDLGSGSFGLFIESNGNFLINIENEIITKYLFGSSWDVSTLSYSGESFNASSQFSDSQDVFLKTDTSLMFTLNGSEEIYEYEVFKESLVLGSGSFASTDVGKRIIGNGGEAILTATDGSFEEQTAFNDDSTIAAGDWSMFALDIESAAAGLTLSGIEGGEIINNDEFISVQSEDPNARGVAFKPDGTRMFYAGDGNNGVYQYELSAPWDVRTASYSSKQLSVSGSGEPGDVIISPDGGKLFTSNNTGVKEYNMSNFDIDTAGFNFEKTITNDGGRPSSMSIADDGRKLYFVNNSNYPQVVFQYDMSTPYELNTVTQTSTTSYTEETNDFGGETSALHVTNDGTEMYIGGRDDGGIPVGINKYVFGTPYDLSTVQFEKFYYDPPQFGLVESVVFGGIPFGSKLFVVDNGNSEIYQYDVKLSSQPTNTNHTAITTASTDTEFWTDINSMTADDASNDGDVYYAVSTDDRTTWKIIDDAEGERAIVRNNGGTWEVNDDSDYGSETWIAASENDEFYALEEALSEDIAQNFIEDSIASSTYTGNFLDVSSVVSNPSDLFIGLNGSKMYVVTDFDDDIFEYDLATAWNVASASYTGNSFNVGNESGGPTGLFFKPDGTKMYTGGYIDDAIFEYNLSTAWDITSASYSGNSFSVSSQEGATRSLFFRDDGLKMYICGESPSGNLFEYNLSTAWDITSASYSGNSLYVDPEDSVPTGLHFKSDGTRAYITGETTATVFAYDLTSPWDLSTGSYSNISFDVSSQQTEPFGLFFKTDESKMYVIGRQDETIHEYVVGSFTLINRMDATQLNAVSDANHYTLGDDLDLAITMFMADGNTSSPTSDGVSINYDAAVINQGAVLGTDYEFDAPAGDTVRIKALSDENFKVKVI